LLTTDQRDYAERTADNYSSYRHKRKIALLTLLGGTFLGIAILVLTAIEITGMPGYFQFLTQRLPFILAPPQPGSASNTLGSLISLATLVLSLIIAFVIIFQQEKVRPTPEDRVLGRIYSAHENLSAFLASGNEILRKTAFRSLSFAHDDIRDFWFDSQLRLLDYSILPRFEKLSTGFRVRILPVAINGGKDQIGSLRDFLETFMEYLIKPTSLGLKKLLENMATLPELPQPSSRPRLLDIYRRSPWVRMTVMTIASVMVALIVFTVGSVTPGVGPGVGFLASVAAGTAIFGILFKSTPSGT
jgi:hypothetical protein